MTETFNRHAMKKRRQTLRNSAPRAELLLWHYLKGKQLSSYKFRRQYSVGGYVLDFYCPRLKLGIEIDGPSHLLSKEVVAYDRVRQRFIESFNINIMRVTNHDIYRNIRGVIEQILNVASAIKKRYEKNILRE